MSEIHNTAIVDPKAQIGDNVSIGAFSIIEGDVVIGNGTRIGTSVHIYNGARIGENCNIHQGAAIANIPQDLKFGGEESLFIIGNNTTIRECVTLNRGTHASGKSEIGSNCLLMAYTHVGHDTVIGDDVILANGVQLGGHVVIEDFAIIGGMTPVHQFCKVGRHSMIGGGFRAVQDVPPYITCAGEPLQFHGLNSIGLRRRGFKLPVIKSLKATYKLLFRSHLNVSQAVERIRNEVEMLPEVENVLAFIENSDRGLIKGSDD